MPSINPFTPSFGGKPEHFFGRLDCIERVTRALDNANSPDCVLFFTGGRGSGKTALLERLSLLARDHRWRVIDVHSSHAAEAVAAQLRSIPAVEATFAPQLALPGGVQVSMGRATTSNGTSSAHVSLPDLLITACEAPGTHMGIFVSIDEIQKIPEADMEAICAAVQMARRKGHSVALMLAGLPGAKERVSAYGGCTFMQRVDDVHIGSLKMSETTQAFEGLFALVGNLEVDSDALWAIASFSQGYPYLMQLVGYHLVRYLQEVVPIGTMCASAADVEQITDLAYQTYRANVLLPSLHGLGEEGRSYLRAMAPLLDEHGRARTGDVAAALDKRHAQLSSCRHNLIRRRLITTAGRGLVRYGLPHLSRLMMEQASDPYLDDDDEWEVR